MRVMPFSREYPRKHPKEGFPTFFVEKIWASLIQNKLASKSKIAEISRLADLGRYFTDEIMDAIRPYAPKGHTIRAGNRWKEGDWFKPVVWGEDVNPKSGRTGPYHSKQIQFAPPILIKKVWNIKMEGYVIHVNKERFSVSETSENAFKLANNDGLDIVNFWPWFPYKPGKIFTGQIICWDENINY